MYAGRQALRQNSGQPGKRLVDVEREAEAPAGLKRNEALEGGANDSGGVDRVVLLYAIAAQQPDEHVHGLGRRGLAFGVVGVRGALQRRIGARVLAGVCPVRLGYSPERVIAGAADGGLLQRGGQLPRASNGEPASQIVKAGDVDVVGDATRDWNPWWAVDAPGSCSSWSARHPLWSSRNAWR